MRFRTKTLLPILILAILALPFPALSQNIDVDRVVKELEPEINRMLSEANVSSASVALVAGDRILWTKAYGLSNRWAGTQANVDTVYLIGSTFKAMATFALLQLMDQGKFKLDDRVGDYLPDFKIQHEDPKKPVTFRHLLTHTSGMPADFGPFPVWGDEAPPTLEEYLKTSLKVVGEPLEKEVYSNMAYSLIGYLVQKLSGKPFKKYVEENVFKPLEMTSTVFNPTPEIEERLSVPYVFDKERNRFAATTRLKAVVWPAGLVYGTISDQANWLIANINGGSFKGKQLISRQSFDQMMTLQFEKFKGPVEGLWGGKNAGFGLTWWVEQRADGDNYFAHSGSVPGYTAFLQGNRDKKLGFAILTNGHQAHRSLFKLADRAIELMKVNSKQP
jgi:CubicO group peptidase (beta-lactamase class C family)